MGIQFKILEVEQIPYPRKVEGKKSIRLRKCEVRL